MGKLIYITGGIKSGKSEIASTYAKDYAHVGVINTHKKGEARIFERINFENKINDIKYFEGDEDIGNIIINNRYGLFIIDDITSLVYSQISLHMENLKDSYDKIFEFLKKQLDGIIASVYASDCDVIAISCEILDASKEFDMFTKYYASFVGYCNQRLAKEADKAIFAVSGLQIAIK